MSFTRSTTPTDVHQNMPDYPSGEGYTTAQLKTAFDAPATGIKSDLNGLMTELEDTSSASNIGATAIAAGDDSDGNVQAKLEKLQDELTGIALGDMPDGSITQAKMNGTYEATIAKKDGTLQIGLNAEKLNGKTEAQLKSAFLSTPNPTTISFTGATKQTQTVTETKTYSTNGSRYFVLISSYVTCKVILYDAKTQKIVYGFGSNYLTTMTSSADLLDSGIYGQVTLTTTYSSGTLTLNLTKTPATGSSAVNTPSGTITIFELGGMV